MRKKLSILIPIYNTEKYLASCLDSVLAQTESDWELILVDDGSTDGSAAICDAYAAKDERIRVYHQKNHGVSAARNFALQMAEGEYIGFVDSDDGVEPHAFETMLNCAREQDADMVLCDALTLYPDGRREADTLQSLSQSVWISRANWQPQQLMEAAGAVWRCIYRRELLQKYKIEFPTGLRFSEDRVFNLLAMGRANGVYYCKQPLCLRLIRMDSAVHKFYPDYFDIVKSAAEQIRLALQTAWDDDAELQKAYLSQFVGGALCAASNYFYRTSTLSGTERRSKVRALCEDELLRSAIEQTGFGGIRGKWILKKRIGLLCLCAMVLNLKHGR